MSWSLKSAGPIDAVRADLDLKFTEILKHHPGGKPEHGEVPGDADHHETSKRMTVRDTTSKTQTHAPQQAPLIGPGAGAPREAQNAPLEGRPRSTAEVLPEDTVVVGEDTSDVDHAVKIAHPEHGPSTTGVTSEAREGDTIKDAQETIYRELERYGAHNIGAVEVEAYGHAYVEGTEVKRNLSIKVSSTTLVE